MNDRVSTYPGRVRLTPVEGQTDVFDMTRADSPTQEGTALNKANLLSDTTASAINTLTGSTPSTPNSALYALTNKISAVITSLLTNTTATAIQTLTGTKPTTADGAFSALTGELSSVEGVLVHIADGTYTGTGTYGSSNATVLNFSFVPQFVVVAPTDAGYSSMNRIVALRGNTKVRNSTGDDSGDNYRLPLTWSGNALSWYSSDAWSQLNQQGTVYHYFAVG